ncbi:hypothetical protein [Halobacillus kuroshimensis]|uniref:hypothetical protein n=1 Tax=Halobacillus kuroshimensis TaxID=302481 RepID=UPI000487D9CE|nr:hypothetical protein [Halobacillus kuroshimensis]
MGERYNLTKLINVYKQAEEETNTIVFESRIGKGRFLFMSFFAEDDDSTKDKIFLYLRNTKRMVNTKMYGNHSKGDFYIYPNQFLRSSIVEELQLNEGAGTPFSFSRFMGEFNASIPEYIPASSKVELIKGNVSIVNKTGAIDEGDKVHLLSIKKVSNGKPQDKTLRKLYMYTKNNPSDIESLIKILKQVNYTTVWGRTQPNNDVNIQEWIDKLS